MFVAFPARRALVSPHRNIFRAKNSDRFRSVFVAEVQNEDLSEARPFEAIPGPLDVPVIGTLWQYKLGKSNGYRLPPRAINVLKAICVRAF